MAKKSEKQQTSALDEVRRHIRVFIDLSRIAGESNEQNRFLDQAVVQVARAVEIDHVKVLKYRRREADLLVTAGYGWKEGVVRSATLSADLRSPPGRCCQQSERRAAGRLECAHGNRMGILLSDRSQEG